METPWLNIKKMEEISSSLQKDMFHSSQFKINNSMDTQNTVRHINIINSSEVNIKYEWPDLKGNDTGNTIEKDVSTRSIEVNHLSESSESTDTKLEFQDEESVETHNLSKSLEYINTEQEPQDKEYIEAHNQLKKGENINKQIAISFEAGNESLKEPDSISLHSPNLEKKGENDHQYDTFLDFINIRVPVVIGEYKMEFCVNDTARFEEKVKRIKDISNEIVLLSCKFVPTQLSPPLENGMCTALKGHVCIDGLLHQNIEYTADLNKEDSDLSMCGKVCSVKRENPFSIFIKIENFLHPPIFGPTTQNAFGFIDPNNKQTPLLDTKLINSTTFYPEQPYCRVVSSKINESISLTDSVYSLNEHHNHVESMVDEKKSYVHQIIEIEVFVHLLQIQHVRIKSG